MTITSPPQLGRPYWTAFTQPEGSSGPIDPLRFDTYAERLGNVLLPGITNRVERLRYFGMVCAGLLLTRPHGGMVDSRQVVRRWRRAFLHFEAGWALSNLLAVGGEIKDRPPAVERARLKNEFEGLRGANRVYAYYRKCHGERRIRPHAYTLLKAQESQGGLGAYLVALRRYGFVQADRFDLTALGLELARAFLGNTARSASRLLSDAPEPRATLRSLGETFLLPRPTHGEAMLVQRTLFAGDGEVARLFARLPAKMRTNGEAQDAFEHIARADGDGLERAAQYALAFDPFRRAVLKTFASLGRQLQGRGPTPLRELDVEDLSQYVAETAAAARVLTVLPTVPGLEPVATLAHRLSEAPSTADVLQAIVKFHLGEGRRWIDLAGPERYVLGAHGAFDDPADHFHGYTLPSAMRLYRDVSEALA